MGSSGLERRGEKVPEPRYPGQVASPRRLAQIVGAAVAGALAVVTAGLVLALLGLGLTGKISSSIPEVLDLVKLGFALVAGVGGTVGLVLAYQRHLIAVEAGQRENAKEVREEAKLFNERFGAAAEQVASEQYAVKLAGVYAMATLADDWDAGRQTCINVLCANLRRGYTTMPSDRDADPDELLAFADNQEFRHTIIAVIATRLREPDSGWHRCNFDFHGTVFDGGDFDGVNFSGGTVSFASAVFSGGTVGFVGAIFSGGTVSFDRAAFTGGTVNFDHAAFTSRTVTFNGAAFAGSSIRFIGAKFTGGTVFFTNASFAGGSVDFNSASFAEGTVGFSNATFAGGRVVFYGAAFSSGRVTFEFAKFRGSDVTFEAARFTGGTVEFSKVSDFSMPPRFGFRLGDVPEGVLLPATPGQASTP
ncbi:uncharacterized protein YjbI with pentapeptide repeats [Catenulispora sp. MAP5-51]|uniref:pentapeptide repeat-containing protein n=1 Tax=Catenulispora sp. MAP5-51 TaxID=3156298 RepID=UPI003518C6D2